MDQPNITKPKKNERRTLFKKCFKDSFFSLVPFEIWRDLIVSNADLKSIVLLFHTCNAFQHLVDEIGENNFNLALLLRKEGQIFLAKKYLLKCADNNNAFAMFHLGYSLRYSSWGLERDKTGAEWLRKSAELGDPHAISYYSICLKYGEGVDVDREQSSVYAQKALSSNNLFAVGYCYYSGMGLRENLMEAFSYFEGSANEGDEFGQYFFGLCFYYGFGCQRSYEKALLWFLKSAEQGHCDSHDFVGSMYLQGYGCEKNKEKAIMWYKKSANQGYENSKYRLRSLGIDY